MSVVMNTNQERGFTLVELLIYMVMFGIVMTAMYSIFIGNTRSYSSQENRVEMTQDLRAAMDLMVREIRMAGCDPTEVGGIGFVNDVDDNYDTDDNSMHFTRDITNTAGTGNPDGATDGPHEDINYYLYVSDGIQKLGRRTAGAGIPQPVAENITSLAFTYRFADGDTGIPDITDGDTTNDLDDIRSVQITIQGETATVDAVTGTKKTRTRSSWVNVRNAGL